MHLEGPVRWVVLLEGLVANLFLQPWRAGGLTKLKYYQIRIFQYLINILFFYKLNFIPLGEWMWCEEASLHASQHIYWKWKHCQNFNPSKHQICTALTWHPYLKCPSLLNSSHSRTTGEVIYPKIHKGKWFCSSQRFF